MKNILEKLRIEKNKIQEKINNLEQEEIEKTQYPRLKKMVGWCMQSKYNNLKSREFSKILEWVENKEWGIYFITENVCINSEGSVSIAIRYERPYVNKEWWGAEIPLYGIERISDTKYEKEKIKLLREMQTRNILRKYAINND